GAPAQRDADSEEPEADSLLIRYERDASKTSLTSEDGAFVRTVQTRAVDVAAELRHIHPLAREHDSNRFLQLAHEHLLIRSRVAIRTRRRVHRGAADDVCATVSPIDHAPREIEIQVDRFR